MLFCFLLFALCELKHIVLKGRVLGVKFCKIARCLLRPEKLCNSSSQAQISFVPREQNSCLKASHYQTAISAPSKPPNNNNTMQALCQRQCISMDNLEDASKHLRPGAGNKRIPSCFQTCQAPSRRGKCLFEKLHKGPWSWMVLHVIYHDQEYKIWCGLSPLSITVSCPDFPYMSDSLVVAFFRLNRVTTQTHGYIWTFPRVGHRTKEQRFSQY